MYITVDLSTVPPGLALREADDFTRFEVLAGQVEHTYIDPAELKRLAGERAEDPAWTEQLDGMLGYASSKGWVREDGAVRGHVEWS